MIYINLEDNIVPFEFHSLNTVTQNGGTTLVLKLNKVTDVQYSTVYMRYFSPQYSDVVITLELKDCTNSEDKLPELYGTLFDNEKVYPVTGILVGLKEKEPNVYLHMFTHIETERD